MRLQDVHGYRTAWPRSGITRLYTWMTRGIRFLDEGSGVRRMAYGPGVQPIDTGVTERDPMVGYRLTKKGELVAVRLSIEKSLWRDFSAMLPEAAGILPATLQHASKWAQTIGRRAGVRVLGQVSESIETVQCTTGGVPVAGRSRTPRPGGFARSRRARRGDRPTPRRSRLVPGEHADPVHRPECARSAPALFAAAADVLGSPRQHLSSHLRESWFTQRLGAVAPGVGARRRSRVGDHARSRRPDANGFAGDRADRPQGGSAASSPSPTLKQGGPDALASPSR